jgi:hypothetical protein
LCSLNSSNTTPTSNTKGTSNDDSNNSNKNNTVPTETSSNSSGINITSGSGDITITDSVLLNQTNNNTYNIIINPKGSEELDDIPELLESLKTSFKKLHRDESVNEMKNISMEVFKHIYCNEDKPENQNMYVTNSRPDIKFFVYKDQGWERSGDLQLLLKEYERINTLIKNNLECVSKNKSFLNELKHVIDGINEHYVQNKRPNKTLTREMSKEFYNTLYINKDTIADTFNLTKTT